MLILSFQMCCFFFLNLVFGSNFVVTLFAFKSFFEHYLSIYIYFFYSIFLSVSVFTYSCSSSGLSSFSSAPDAVVAVSSVGVSADASWSPFVAVVLT